MTNQPTPETAAKLSDDPHPPSDSPDYARALEIQRNEARAERDAQHERAVHLALDVNSLRQERNAAIAERDDALLRLQIATAKWDAARAEFSAQESAARAELADERAKKSDALIAAVDDIERLRAALELIAAPMRPDGWYERDRTACGSIARAALATSAQ